MRSETETKKLKIPPLNLKGIDGTEIGEAMNDLSPRTKGRALVAATRNVNMFGNRFNTDTEEASRRSIHVHPYPWTTAGASIVPVFKDGNDEIYIAVVHNKRKDGNKKRYRLAEGYMHPKGCPDLPDGLPTKFQPNDEAENAIAFKGVDHKKAYTDHPPLKAKEPDKNLIDTVKREAGEELGVEISSEQLTRLGIHESDGAIHCVSTYYLADFNYPGSKYSSFTVPPELKSKDPAEIDEIRWIKPMNIESRGTDKGLAHFIDGSEILPKYANFIGHAMLAIRKKELEQVAGPYISTVENLFAQVNLMLEKSEDSEESEESEESEVPIGEIMGFKPATEKNHLAELGFKAELRHRKIMALAKCYKEHVDGKKIFEIQPIAIAELQRLIEEVERDLQGSQVNTTIKSFSMS